jgi:WXG100 family type VII secretion target
MKFQVDLTALTSTATGIEARANEYKQLYERLYTEVQAMGGNWQGKDNQAYVSQLNGFKDDFERMHRLLLDFAALIKDANTEYKQALSDSTAVARSIN